MRPCLNSDVPDFLKCFDVDVDLEVLFCVGVDQRSLNLTGDQCVRLLFLRQELLRKLALIREHRQQTEALLQVLSIRVPALHRMKP